MKEIYLIDMDSEYGGVILTLEGDEELIDELKAITWEEYASFSPNKHNKCETTEEAFVRNETVKKIKREEPLENFDLNNPDVIYELENYQYEPYYDKYMRE